tara:strand:- start:4990 stop:5976 length:987 start_codon:yes stop_codon:yes gene_type:complete
MNSNPKSVQPGIGFGTWSWGNKLLWGYNPQYNDALLERAFIDSVNGGLELVDTADSYGTGQLEGRSEILIGNFIKKLSINQRNKLTIATKLAPFPWRLGRRGFDKAFYLSQKRLQGNIDRVQIHWSTSRYAPWQEKSLLNGLGDLNEKGLIKEVGLSNFGLNNLKIINNSFKLRGLNIKSLQIQLSLLCPDLENSKYIRDFCLEENIQLIAYSPLALGVLSVSPYENKMNKQTFLRNQIYKLLLKESLDLRKAIHNIAIERNASQAQVAINWCREFGALPIPGIRTSAQAKDIINALNWKLNKEEFKKLNLLSEKCKRRMPKNPFSSN